MSITKANIYKGYHEVVTDHYYKWEKSQSKRYFEYRKKWEENAKNLIVEINNGSVSKEKILNPKEIGFKLRKNEELKGGSFISKLFIISFTFFLYLSSRSNFYKVVTTHFS